MFLPVENLDLNLGYFFLKIVTAKKIKATITTKLIKLINRMVVGDKASSFFGSVEEFWVSSGVF